MVNNFDEIRSAGNLNPFERYSDILQDFKAQNRLRSIPEDRSQSYHIDLTSNDYLGIGEKSKDFVTDFLKANQNYNFSSSASRLLSRRQEEHKTLESELATLYDKDVLLFNSGYHANVGIIQALNIPGTIFLCDKLIHASMIDGLKLADAEYRRWRHNDIKALTALLEKHRNMERCIIIVESIYSMDGDESPLKEIVALKKRFPNIILYVDEAHAIGVRGKQGLGICEELGIIDETDILVGTFGKALASSGAFVAADSVLIQFLINSSRSFIFSTALPPVNSAWTLFVLRRVIGMQGEREHLKKISERFRKGIEEITGIPSVSSSQIIPIIVGDADKAIKLSNRLARKNIDSMPIRRPTVAPGTERIRLSLSASLTDYEVDYILNAIRTELYDL